MTMAAEEEGGYIVATVEPSSAVYHSIYARFLAPTSHNIVIAKSNRLEVHEISSEGLLPELQIPINGRITNGGADYLLVITEKERYSIIKYDGASNTVCTVESGDLHDRACRPIERGQIVAVGEKSQVIAIHMVQGLVKLLGIETRHSRVEPVFTPPVNRRIDELQVVDMQMLGDTDQPTLAVLHHTIGDTFKISTYVIVNKGNEKDLTAGPWSFDDLDYGSYMLIAVPAPKGGIIAISDEAIFYYNHTKKAQCALAMKPCRFSCHCRIDDTGYRYLFGDTNGNLFVLILFGEGDLVESLKLEYLGKTVIASTLTYLDHAYVYVGSHYGDAQIIQLSSSRLADGSFVSVVDTIPCSAPIVDFITADVENSGQSSIIACSGAFKEGALRFIRRGSNLVVTCVAELGSFLGILNAFAFSLHKDCDIIFLSTLTGNKILRYSPQLLEELNQFQQLTLPKLPCILVEKLEKSIYLVTADSVTICSVDADEPFHLWQPPKGDKICFAAHWENHLILSTATQELFWHDCRLSPTFNYIPAPFVGSEICALSVVKIQSKVFIAMALWGETSIRFIGLKGEDYGHDACVTVSAAVRSLCFAIWDTTPVIFVGLGDGTVVHCLLHVSGNPRKLLATNTHRVTLGLGPVHFFRTQYGLFACSDKPFLITMSNMRVSFSLTNAKNVRAMVGLSVGKKLLVIRDDDLLFCKLEVASKFHLHHQEQRMEQTVTRIADLEASKALVTLGSIAPYPCMSDFSSQEENTTSRVILVDRETLISMVLVGGLGEKAHSLMTLFLEDLGTQAIIVGSAVVRGPGQEPEEGRILTFVVNGHHKLQLLSQTKVSGCVYAMASLQQPGRMVAAINGMTSLFKWTRKDPDSNAGWTLVHSHFGHVLGIKLDVHKDLVAVGDLMKSVNLLRVDDKQDKLVEIARDFDPNWITEVRFLSDTEIVAADNLGNIFVLVKQRDAHFSGGERWTLKIKSGFHLGEIVNKIERGTLARVGADHKLEPLLSNRHLIGTTSGSIVLLGQVDGPTRLILEVLQENLRKVLPPVGELPHGEWRAIATERRRCKPDVGCFIDGDLIAKFLDLDKDARRIVAEGGAACDATGASVAEVSLLIDNLVATFQ